MIGEKTGELSFRGYGSRWLPTAPDGAGAGQQHVVRNGGSQGSGREEIVTLIYSIYK